MWRIPARRSAAQWTALQVELAAIRRTGGRPSARLRYEDFVDDPVGSLVHVTDLLGVPLNPADLPRVDGGQVSLSASHGLSGNSARFVSGVVELRRDDAWTRAMPAGDRAVVTALTLPLLLAYGYQVAPGPTTSSRQAPRIEARSTP